MEDFIRKAAEKTAARDRERKQERERQQDLEREREHARLRKHAAPAAAYDSDNNDDDDDDDGPGILYNSLIPIPRLEQPILAVAHNGDPKQKKDKRDREGVVNNRPIPHLQIEGDFKYGDDDIKAGDSVKSIEAKLNRLHSRETVALIKRHAAILANEIRIQDGKMKEAGVYEGVEFGNIEQGCAIYAKGMRILGKITFVINQHKSLVAVILIGAFTTRAVVSMWYETSGRLFFLPRFLTTTMMMVVYTSFKYFAVLMYELTPSSMAIAGYILSIGYLTAAGALTVALNIVLLVGRELVRMFTGAIIWTVHPSVMFAFSVGFFTFLTFAPKFSDPEVMMSNMITSAALHAAAEDMLGPFFVTERTHNKTLTELTASREELKQTIINNTQREAMLNKTHAENTARLEHEYKRGIAEQLDTHADELHRMLVHTRFQVNAMQTMLQRTQQQFGYNLIQKINSTGQNATNEETRVKFVECELQFGAKLYTYTHKGQQAQPSWIESFSNWIGSTFNINMYNAGRREANKELLMDNLILLQTNYTAKVAYLKADVLLPQICEIAKCTPEEAQALTSAVKPFFKFIVMGFTNMFTTEIARMWAAQGYTQEEIRIGLERMSEATPTDLSRTTAQALYDRIDEFAHRQEALQDQYNALLDNRNTAALLEPPAIPVVNITMGNTESPMKALLTEMNQTAIADLPTTVDIGNHNIPARVDWTPVPPIANPFMAGVNLYNTTNPPGIGSRAFKKTKKKIVYR